MAPPFKVVEFDVIYRSGISKEGEIIDMAARLSIIEKSEPGLYNGNKLGQEEAVKALLKEKPDLANEMSQKSGQTMDCKMI